MTGEGQLDATSFDGKVVGGVLGLVAGRVPVLCVVGRVGDGNRWATPPGLAELVDLSARVGPERAHREVQRLVEQAVVDYLGALG
jgi:glycerate kinase